MTRLQVRVQEALRLQIDEQASRLGLTVSEYVVGAIGARLAHDADTANRIQLAAADRDRFFQILEDRSPLPDVWEAASLLAADVSE